MVDDLTAEQKKVDADVEQVKTRRARDRDRMDQGLITNPKDLERMQHELVSLERRITTLEDEELEVMERLEEAQKRSSTRSLEQLGAADERLGAARRGAGPTGSPAIDEELAAARRRAGAHRGRGMPGRPDGALRPAARAEGRGRRGRRCAPASAAAAG